MKAWIALLALLQAPAAPPPPPPPAPAVQPQAPKVEPYRGTSREARRALAELSDAGKHDEVQRLCEQVLARADFEQEPEGARAELWYALGVGYGNAGELAGALKQFHRAQGLAGSSELGRDALFDAGTLLLQRAEELRKQVPEIAQKLKLPTPPQAPPAPGQGQGQASDPLATARTAYLDARGELVQRWRIEPLDADTRADLELIQRRLRELDELAKQREEQKQQQQQQQDPQPKDDPKQDPQQQQDPNQQQPKPQDQQEPSKQDPQTEPEDPKQQPDPQRQDQESPKDQQPPPESKPDAGKPREQMLLTPEEMQRLMDQLEKIEKQALEVQRALRERRKTPVKKDW